VSWSSGILELRSGRGRAAACALLLTLGACSLFGPSFSAFRGETLRTAEAEGEEALELMQRVPALRSWVEQNGKPDYVRADSDRRLVIFYLERDQVVRFSRGRFSREYSASSSQPIRSDDHELFINADRERLGRVRLGQQPSPPQEPATRGEGVVRKRVGGDTQPAAEARP
jgi:hypothetical protein